MNLKGSTIIEDNDGELVLSVPKAKAAAPAEAPPMTPVEKLNAKIPGAATVVNEWGTENAGREPQGADDRVVPAGRHPAPQDHLQRRLQAGCCALRRAGIR
jgi:hypothetical protein